MPNVPSIIQSILQEFHSSMLGGHAGIARTKARIASQFTWPSMSRDIRLFVSQCLICQQAKYSTAAPASLLQPLPIPSQIWDDVSIGMTYPWTLLPGCHHPMDSRLSWSLWTDFQSIAILLLSNLTSLV